MKRILLLLWLASAALAGDPAGAPRADRFAVAYELVITDRGEARVAMQVEHPPDAGIIVSIGGAEPDFGKDIRGLEATGESGRKLVITALERRAQSRDDQRWRIDNRAGESFELVYHVVCSKSSHEGPDFQDASHRPSLFADWALLFGHAAFLIPRDGSQAPEKAVLTVRAPEGWPVITDFGDRFETGDVSDLHWILIAAGDFQRIERKVGGVELQVAVLGMRRFTVDRAAGWIEKVIAAQIAIFGRHPNERAVVLVLPSRPGHWGGSVYGKTIELKLPPEEALDDPESISLIAHEHFHVWNGRAIEPSPERPEGHLKWFSEGATRYYEKLTLFRAGLIELDDLVRLLNDSIRSYWLSPVRPRATAAAMEERYWTEPGYEEFGYQGGAVRALVIDTRLRGMTQGRLGLDDLMRKLFEEAAAGSSGLLNDDLRARLAELSQEPWDEFFHDHIDGVADLPIAESCRPAGLDAPIETQAIFERGFEIQGGELYPGVAVAAVVEGSAAEMAGLRPGDKLVGYGFVDGAPDYEMNLDVDRGGERIDLRFFPKREQELPVLKIADRARAAAFFRGEVFAPGK